MIRKTDMITFLNKLYNDTLMFNFSSSHSQKQMVKLHKFMMINLPKYQEICTMPNLEVNPNFNNEKDIKVPTGILAIKSLNDVARKRTELIYFLGIPDQEKLKVIFNDEPKLGKYMATHHSALYGQV